MQTFSEFSEKSFSALMDKHKAFFAFGDKQFDEQREEGVRYVQAQIGLLVPKDSYKAFLTEFNELHDSNVKGYMEKYSKKEIIRMELWNHECGYTYDYENAFEAVESLGITEDEVAKEFREWIKTNGDE